MTPLERLVSYNDADERQVAELDARLTPWRTHLEPWRDDRGPGWFRDVGYALQDVLRAHRYRYELKGAKPDDPGWHACSCGWEGYWSGFEPHVADHLRAVVVRDEDAL